VQVATARLVTPEAVVLQFETAGLGSRFLATLLDLAIQGSVLFLTAIASTVLASTGDGSAVAATVGLLLVVAGILLGYPVAFETLWRGRTPGKAALGLRVVTRDGAPVRFRHAAVRGALGLVDLWATTGAAAVIAILLSRDNQRLGDLAAGTLVLRERSGAGRPAAVRFPVPPGWDGYAATLDTAGLSGTDYGAVRSFLLRAASLPPAVRVSLAQQVADGVVARLRRPPPPGADAETFLRCVAAVHQRRSAPGAGPAAQTWAPAAAVWAPPVEADPRASPVAARPASQGGFQAPE
jgi:uncharacterized RDD family membrane protein YckC